MNARNAFAFLALGAAMGLLPRWDPGLFPLDGCDGTSARAIWSEVMGLIQALLGSTYLIKHYLLLPALRWDSRPAHERRPSGVLLPGARRADLF